MPLDDPEKTKADRTIIILYIVMAVFVGMPFVLFFIFGKK
jgi:hypothetical protein